MRLSLYTHIEQFLRTVCFFYFFIAAIVTLLINDLLRPIYPNLDKLTGHYFTRNFKIKPLDKQLVKFTLFGMFKLFGIDYIVENRPTRKAENCIVMFTHGSNLDPPLLQLLFPTYLHFIAKKSLFKIPFFGRVLSIIGQIPIERTSLQAAIQSLDVAANLLTVEKKSIAISPEGTRRRKASTGPDQLLSFKKGPFHLAKKAKVDIIPVVIMGANRIWPSWQPYPCPGTVVVRFCEKIPKEDVEKMSIEKLQATLSSIYQDNLTPIDNRVIFNTSNKPYLMFVATLVGLLTTWTLFFRFFLY